MREIIFRGKRMANDEWVTGDMLTYDSYFSIIHTGNSQFHVYHDTVGQYTGYNDAMNARVYEGDIVEFFSRVYDEEGCVMFEKMKIGHVRFSFGQWSVRIPKINMSTNLYGIDSRKIVVVGNVHDNPELVEEES